MGPWTDAFCVRYVRTDQAMPWPYKVLDLSFILMPPAITWAACLRDGRFIRVEYWLMAVVCWLIFLLNIANQIRGRYALKRGVLPAPPGADMTLAAKMDKLATAICGLVFGTSLLLAFGHKGHSQDLADILLMFVLFVMSLSSYSRARFWNLELE
jgi:hypothetical protein